jgi:hypothetical protein
MPLPEAARRYPPAFPDGTEHRQVVRLSLAIDHPNLGAGPSPTPTTSTRLRTGPRGWRPISTPTRPDG